MNPSPYKAQHSGSDYKVFIEGPGDGYGYYSGTLWPEKRFETFEEAEKVAKMMNDAFREGIKAQQSATKKVLGL